MTEFELIARLIPSLATNPSVLVGAGDDCAVLDLGIPSHALLFKTDTVVEGIHFNKGTDPQRIGHKALARCLSDIAAMAGQPAHALVTLGLPKDFDVGFVDNLYRGLNTLAARYQIAIVGGETTLNPAGVFVSIAVIGTVAKEKYVVRSGAQAGDAIFVTGELGGSLEGKHLDFEPRLVEAQWLAGHFDIHSMIDISDGLGGDLRHLLTASRAGAELLAKAIPISRAARIRGRLPVNPGTPGEGAEHSLLGGHASARSSETTNVPPAAGVKPALLAALTDGEDFELLFTVASHEAVPLLDAWKQRFPDLRLSCIGRIVAGSGLFLKDKDSVSPFTGHGYVHFS